ncbi:MAG: hypothetical protein M1832_004611 [Thelocarpon impressellum]|nr:MAG: hypothetical protein M1832_004611 [Thelocarpon impressellum]
MGPEQIALSWGLMTLQGGRRLYECIALGKPSQSTMWFVHWLLGIAFYGAMSMAVWVEGIPILRRTEPSLVLVTPGAPSFRTMICLPLFLIASGIQHDCHSYLASLPKYTLPSHPIFQILICPHYFAECLIYLGLAGIAAPAGSWLNGTIFTALVFVVVNLGVTAETSREWYVGKFGAESVKGRWKMIPFVY